MLKIFLICLLNVEHFIREKQNIETEKLQRCQMYTLLKKTFTLWQYRQKVCKEKPTKYKSQTPIS